MGGKTPELRLASELESSVHWLRDVNEPNDRLDVIETNKRKRASLEIMEKNEARDSWNPQARKKTIDEENSARAERRNREMIIRYYTLPASYISSFPPYLPSEFLQLLWLIHLRFCLSFVVFLIFISYFLYSSVILYPCFLYWFKGKGRYSFFFFFSLKATTKWRV